MAKIHQCPMYALCPKSAGSRPSTDTWGWSFPPTSNEIQLNIPSRPRVLVRQLDARGNEVMTFDGDNLQQLNCISADLLTSLAAQIYNYTKITVRCAPTASLY